MNEVMRATIGAERVTIYYEDQPESPREWDNLGHMICFHRRYNLGDKHDMTVEELKELVRREDVIALPLYLYDHSGLRIATSTARMVDVQWDVSMVGYIYVTLEDIRKCFNKKRVSKKLRNRVRTYLNGEVETYDQYLMGDVYGFVHEKKVVCECCNNVEYEHLNSCWGFYGHKNLPEVILGHLDKPKKWRNAEWEDLSH